MKKVFKIIGIFLLLIVIALIAAPFLFKDSIEKIVKRTINENLNATVAWESLDLSLFSSFPDATLTINNFSVMNNAPFKGDTLASGKLLTLDMGVTQLFKTQDESIKIDALYLEEAFINIKVDKEGNANYDVAIKNDAPLTDETTGNAGFSFDLKRYELKDSRINYLDESTENFLILTDINHTGKGDFSLATSELDTKTEAIVSYKLGDIAYLDKNKVTLDAVILMDLVNEKYTFKENEARVNQLPLTLDGFVKLNETNNEVDLTIKTPSSDFKNFLAVIPEVYVKNLDGVTTTGNFTVNGVLKGIVDDNHIPTMDIKIRSDNASFKYAALPKAVENITISADLINTTGRMQDTYVMLNGVSFKIDDELFTTSGSIKNLTTNMLIDLAMKGTLNLANIEKVLPIELDQDLTGVFFADARARFDMEAIDTEQYNRIHTAGTASLTDFSYNDPAFKNPININTAGINMKAGSIQLTQLEATSGTTDIAASGQIQNLIPFLMSKQDLKGTFIVNSKNFNVNDFMTAETSANETSGKTSESSTEVAGAKIPDFLDARLNFTADKVIYDNLELKETKGSVVIKNETASLENVTSKILGGDIAFGGNVNTQNSTPTFAMDLDLSKVNLAQSFKELKLLEFLAPIMQNLDGILSTNLKLSGNLTQEMTPDLKSLSGNAIAQILTAEFSGEKSPLLSKLDEKLSFIDLDDLGLRDVATALSFKDGGIQVAPFDFDVKGIQVTASGSHKFDKTMDYSLSLDVPARYMGNQVGGLLAKLNAADAETMTVALPVTLKGSFSNPEIGINTNAAISQLTQQIIAAQKDQIKDGGLSAIKDLLTGGKNTPQDSTSTGNSIPSIQTTIPTSEEEVKEEIKDVIKNGLGNLFGKKKKDSTGN